VCRFRPPFVSMPCSRIIHNVSRPSNDRASSPDDRISSYRHQRGRHKRFYRDRPSASHTPVTDNRPTLTYVRIITHIYCVILTTTVVNVVLYNYTYTVLKQIKLLLFGVVKVSWFMAPPSPRKKYRNQL